MNRRTIRIPASNVVLGRLKEQLVPEGVLFYIDKDGPGQHGILCYTDTEGGQPVHTGQWITMGVRGDGRAQVDVTDERPPAAVELVP